MVKCVQNINKVKMRYVFVLIYYSSMPPATCKRRGSMKKYSFLFPACRHFLLHVLQVIVLIVSCTFLLCSSFLCAFTGSKIGLVIYIKHLGEIAFAAIFSHSIFYSDFLLIHNLTMFILFWHSMAN